MATNQNQTQEQQPSPPSSSPRYLLVVPKSITSLKDLGIGFIPFHESHSKSSRSIGAKISSLDESPNCTNSYDGNNSTNMIRMWISQYNMKVGDVIYKVNDNVVKTRSFGSIIERLETLFSNRSRCTGDKDSNCMISLVMERKDGESTPERSPTATVEPLSLSMDLSRETNVLQSIFSSKRRIQTSQKDGKHSARKNVF